jgi:hypothetical protein
MQSPFNALRYSPTRWAQLEKEFPKGAHWTHVVQHMLNVVMFNVNDGVRELDIRNNIKFGLKGKPKAMTRTLTVTCRKAVRKQLTVKLDAKGCLIGENYICLDSEGAVTRLAHALIDIIERFWNSSGR